jgi:hypothetical protein
MYVIIFSLFFALTGNGWILQIYKLFIDLKVEFIDMVTGL